MPWADTTRRRRSLSPAPITALLTIGRGRAKRNRKLHTVQSTSPISRGRCGVVADFPEIEKRDRRRSVLEPGQPSPSPPADCSPARGRAGRVLFWVRSSIAPRLCAPCGFLIGLSTDRMVSRVGAAPMALYAPSYMRMAIQKIGYPKTNAYAPNGVIGGNRRPDRACRFRVQTPLGFGDLPRNWVFVRYRNARSPTRRFLLRLG